MNYYNIIHCTIFDSINEFKVGLLSIYLKYIFLFLNKKNMYIFPYFCLKMVQSESSISTVPKKDISYIHYEYYISSHTFAGRPVHFLFIY